MADAPVPNPVNDPGVKGEDGKRTRQLLDSKDAIEWSLVAAVLVGILIWAFLTPWKAENIYKENDLNHAIDVDNYVINNNKPNTVEVKNAMRDLQERTRDLAVWTRYETELREFEWISKLNWQLYAGLKILMIFGAVITPALITKKDFGNKLAILFSILTAMSAGMITEFNFKGEASRAEKAIAMLVTEKTLFITQSDPSYSLLCCSPTSIITTDATKALEIPAGAIPAAIKQETGAEKKKDKEFETKVTKNLQTVQIDAFAAAVYKKLNDSRSDLFAGEPFPKPSCYEEARANFAYAITRIYGNAEDDRLLFLGKKDDNAAQSSSEGKSPSH